MGKLIIHEVKKARNEYKCDVCGAPIKPGDSYFWYQKVRDPYRYKRCVNHYPTKVEIETNPKERLRIQLQQAVENAVCNSETKDDFLKGLRNAVEIGQTLHDQLRETLNNWDGLPVAYSDRFIRYEDGMTMFADYVTELNIFIETTEANSTDDLLTIIAGVPMVPEINLGAS